MRINQTKGEREQENLLLFGVFLLKAEGFGFFFNYFTIGAYSFRELKKKETVERKKTRSKTTQ